MRGQVRLQQVLIIYLCSNVLLVDIFAENSGNSSYSTNETNTYHRCPSTVNIYTKRYFNDYIEIFDNGTVSGIFSPLLQDNLAKVCCEGENISINFVNETSNFSVQKILFTKRDERRKSQTFDSKTLDLYFPTFTASFEASRAYKEFYFVEIMRSPGPALIMLADELKLGTDPTRVLIECWPLFVLLFVMAWFVGILGWFLDRKKNENEFPNNFYKGSWEGFWWAMVTMTTVGYGDKSPKSIQARTLTVLWMITGTIITSLFTANVTTVLTTKNVAALQNVVGHKVGVLNSKHFFQREINEGASFIEFMDEEKMYDAIYKKKITRYIAPNYLDHLYFDSRNHLKKGFVVAKVVKHPFSVGLGLVDDPKHLNEYTENFLKCWERNIIMNYEESGIDYSEIDPSAYHIEEDAKSLLNQNSILRLIYGLVGSLVIFFTLGSLWEFWKKQRRKLDKIQKADEMELASRYSPTLH